MTGLALAGEEQHRLAVLVLEPLQAFPVLIQGDIEPQLVRRVGVQVVSDLLRRSLDLPCVRACVEQVGHAVEIRGIEHAFLGKGELENGVFRGLVPIDEGIDHIIIDPERQDAGHDLHLEVQLIRHARKGGDAVQIPQGIDLEAAGAKARFRRPG